MLAVTLTLLLIVMSGRFIKYLAEAASGGLAADVLFTIMAYRLPGFLELILPLGFFLGILLCYGKLYLDSEMTVLAACGMSMRRLVAYTLITAMLVATVVGYLSLNLTAWGATQAENIFREQDSRTEFDTLMPGQFQTLGSKDGVTYTEKLSDDRKQMHNLFISQHQEKKDSLVLLVAETGTQYIDEATGSRFLLLENGYRYDGNPGELNYRVTKYQQYGVRIPPPKTRKWRLKSELKTTASLMESDDLKDIAQLQWRISLPLLVPIVTLLAIPLSRVNPRQGRYVRLLPAIFLYMGYLIILTTAKSALEDGKIPPYLGLWWVHLLFLSIGLSLLSDIHRKLPWFGK